VAAVASPKTAREQINYLLDVSMMRQHWYGILSRFGIVTVTARSWFTISVPDVWLTVRRTPILCRNGCTNHQTISTSCRSISFCPWAPLLLQNAKVNPQWDHEFFLNTTNVAKFRGYPSGILVQKSF